jgi:uncharacterized RmlC-like cupin family protein
MDEGMHWRSGVRVVRDTSLRRAQSAPGAGGRATVFDFTGAGGRATWIGRVVLPAGASTGPHHHGRHEVALAVLEGQVEIRWGAQLEFLADAGPGDAVYFAPGVPHQERNPSAARDVSYLVVRSDHERIVVPLPIEVAAAPQRVE